MDWGLRTLAVLAGAPGAPDHMGRAQRVESLCLQVNFFPKKVSQAQERQIFKVPPAFLLPYWDDDSASQNACQKPPRKWDIPLNCPSTCPESSRAAGKASTPPEPISKRRRQPISSPQSCKVAHSGTHKTLASQEWISLWFHYSGECHCKWCHF